MSVRKHYRIQLPIFDLASPAILAALYPSALKQTAVDEDTRLIRNDVIGRASDVTCRSKEVYFHCILASLTRRPPPETVVRPAVLAKAFQQEQSLTLCAASAPVTGY
jgi:hypothetical protein